MNGRSWLRRKPGASSTPIAGKESPGAIVGCKCTTTGSDCPGRLISKRELLGAMARGHHALHVGIRDITASVDRDNLVAGP